MTTSSSRTTISSGESPLEFLDLITNRDEAGFWTLHGTFQQHGLHFTCSLKSGSPSLTTSELDSMCRRLLDLLTSLQGGWDPVYVLTSFLGSLKNFEIVSMTIRSTT